jgi:hypothetical protein
MAKDLPYFKFFCSEWNDGDVTLETFEHQGLFINICSYYWSNECDLHLDKLLKRFRGFEELIDDLSAANLFKINEDRTISITFLDEQAKDRGKLCNQNSINAKKRWEKKRKESEKDAVVLNSHSENNAIKKREEEIRKEKIIVIEELPQTNLLNEELFLKRWCDARTYYDKLPTNIKKLTTFEKIDFNELRQDYNLKEFEQAMQGMFQQKTFPKTRLRPTHFLKREHFETYLTCFTTKEKLFDDNKYKKPIERI